MPVTTHSRLSSVPGTASKNTLRTKCPCAGALSRSNVSASAGSPIVNSATSVSCRGKNGYSSGVISAMSSTIIEVRLF